MTTYTIIFGSIIKKQLQKEEIIYYKVKDPLTKKVIDLKDFLTFYDNRLCICMLKLYNLKHTGLFGNDYVLSTEYCNDNDNENENENELPLSQVNCNNNNNVIGIVKNKNKCICRFLDKNQSIYNLGKRDLINEYLNRMENLRIKFEEEKSNELKQKEEEKGLLSKENEELKNKIKELEENIAKEGAKIDILEKKKEWEMSENKKFENFYDIIIDINSILKLKIGWNIEMTDNGIIKYNKYKDVNLVTIGVVGNMNKGKSFILSKFSGIKLPVGININTKGLSIKYPEIEQFKNRKYILLDSAGFENPILNFENDKDIYKKQEEEAKENGNEQELFREKAKDILITEAFLQNFIITTSDVLLLIVDNLTYTQQKMINKIKTEIRKTRKEKKLFIIHNLKTYRSKNQMINYVENILKKSGTFNLQKHEHITKKNEIEEVEHYTEPEQKGFKGIYHLLFAADGSEAGNIYNPYLIDFIESQCNDVIGRKNFDIINEIKQIFSYNSTFFLNEKIEFNDFLSHEEILKYKIFKLEKEKDLSLKRCFIDEIGIQKFLGNGFEPQYNFFRNGDILEIRVELPGNVTPKIEKPKINDEHTIITISGEKKKDKEPKNEKDNIVNTRDFGEFNIQIVFRVEDYRIKPQIKEKEIKKGILFLKYDIENDKQDEKVTIIENEDEI